MVYADTIIFYVRIKIRIKLDLSNRNFSLSVSDTEKALIFRLKGREGCKKWRRTSEALRLLCREGLEGNVAACSSAGLASGKVIVASATTIAAGRRITTGRAGIIPTASSISATLSFRGEELNI